MRLLKNFTFIERFGAYKFLNLNFSPIELIDRVKDDGKQAEHVKARIREVKCCSRAGENRVESSGK